MRNVLRNIGLPVAVAATGFGCVNATQTPQPITVVSVAESQKSKKPEKPKVMTKAEREMYHAAIARTAAMTNDQSAQALAAKHGLNVVNVTWEDTGRYKGSSVGPNISDMTIQVASRDSAEKLTTTCMPVIREPNFSDKTADLDPQSFTLLVGNAKGKDLRRVSLHDFLIEPTRYLTKPESWKGNVPKNLFAPERDGKVLVSAQACFLPIPKGGVATFNPVLFNYQSGAKNPAVLTILATREGTSATIIDNTRDAFETGAVWGQRLFHNAKGERASLTGTRESDFKTDAPAQTPTVGNPETRKPEAGMNMVLLIQVPLKHKEPEYRALAMDEMAMPAPMSAAGAPATRMKSNVENAVIGHGELEGKFTEIDGLPIERDSRFPVRVTVQFYKATDNGVVDEADLKAIHEQIERVYAQSDYVGSLVTAGETGRVTEYDGAKVQPAGWWEAFWKSREKETGKSREQIQAELSKLLGKDYQSRPVTWLYLRDKLRTP
ncbi:MAG: hypothetical protein H7Y38_03325 [Armatimonadetes bacterium]|nr:hypothetical protein [Armatimonadota bacterium]